MSTDNRVSIDVQTDAGQSTSSGTESTAKKKEARIEIGGKEEDPKDIDEKQDAEKPLMDENNQEIKITYDEIEEKKAKIHETPTLPLPPFKSRDHTENEKRSDSPNIYTKPVKRIKYEWETSTGLLEFFTKATCAIFACVGWLVVVGGIPLWPIVELIIGSTYMGHCPVEPRIPEYLVVSGFFGTILHVIAIITKYTPKSKSCISPNQRTKFFCLEVLLQIFLVIWFLAGCAWVYGIYEPEYEMEYHEDYCHRVVYLFAFWTFNITFITLLLFIALGIVVIACIAISSNKDKVSEDPESPSLE